MSNTTNDFAELQGNFKQVYADKIQSLLPKGAVLASEISFSQANKTGDLYNQPLVLNREHGFTYGGSEGTAFALRQGISSGTKNAEIRGHEMVLRSFIAVSAVSRSKGKAAFVQATKLIVQNMMESFYHRLEAQLMYGQADGGIGVVESVSSNDVKVEDHEWAPGIWSGSEKMPVEIRSSAGALRGEANVASVSISTKTITLDAIPAGTVATDVIYFAGAYNKEFAGLHKIITNSGTLFNINAASYSLWQGNTVNVGTNFSGGEATLSFAKVEEAISRAMDKGLADKDVMVICNPTSWNNLLTEQAAKRSYDQSYDPKKTENGSKTITFHGMNGMIEVKASIFCKEGYAYVFPKDAFMRIGSSEITMEDPAMGGQFLKLVESSNAYEMRAYTDQALFCAKPGLCTLLTFIKA